MREVRLKEHAIECRTTSGAFLFLICIISTELNRQLPGRYNVINQHQIIFWTRMLLLSVSSYLNYFSTYQYYNKRALTEQIVPVGLVSLSWITWWKYFLSCPKQGLEMESVVLHRVGLLEYFCPKQGQDFKPSAAPIYPNMGKVPPSPPGSTRNRCRNLQASKPPGQLHLHDKQYKYLTYFLHLWCVTYHLHSL